MHTVLDPTICKTCGTNYPTPSPQTCAICLDSRQFVPPTGQSWTTPSQFQEEGYRLVFEEIDGYNGNITSVRVEPKFAIGHRAFLIKTPQGNIMWDCLPFLDNEALEKIKSLGGISAIGISHPHFYGAYPTFAHHFNCPVYACEADREWIQNTDSVYKLITTFKTAVSPLPNTTIIPCGGHFPGSSCLLFKKTLFTSDTIMICQDLKHFSLMYSFPNYIPLPPKEVIRVWEAVKEYVFEDALGAFAWQFVRGGAREKVWKSVRRYVEFEGWETAGEDDVVLIEGPKSGGGVR